MIDNPCVRENRGSLVKVEENRRKAIFRNPSGLAYTVAHIDGCLVKDASPRADYAVSDESTNSVIVELKGADVQHACDQVFAAVRHQNVKPHLRNRVGFLIVCSRFPRFDTIVRKAKDRAAKEFKSGLHVVCNQGTFDIEKVVKINGPY